MNVIVRCSLMLIGAASLFEAAASPIVISNPGFETASLSISGNGTYSNLVAGSTITSVAGTLPSWTLNSSTVAAAAGGFSPSAGSPNWNSTWWGGNNIAYIQVGLAGATVSLSQTLSDTLLNDTTYTLSALIGNRLFGDLENYSLQLLAGSTLLASASNNVALTNGTFGTDSLTYSSGSSNALAGQALTIRLLSTGVAGSGTNNPTEAFFDNITLDAVTAGASPVPEPATGWVSAGLLLALYSVRKKAGIGRV